MSTKVEAITHAVEMLVELTKLLADIHADRVPPDEALAHIAALHDRLIAARSLADQALAARFASQP